jgi:hypothetical protein
MAASESKSGGKKPHMGIASGMAKDAAHIKLPREPKKITATTTNTSRPTKK